MRIDVAGERIRLRSSPVLRGDRRVNVLKVSAEPTSERCNLLLAEFAGVTCGQNSPSPARACVLVRERRLSDEGRWSDSVLQQSLSGTLRSTSSGVAYDRLVLSQ